MTINKSITTEEITTLAATGRIDPLIKSGLSPADATAIHVGAYAANAGAGQNLIKEAAVAAGSWVQETHTPEDAALLTKIAVDHAIREGYDSIMDGLTAAVAAAKAENILLNAQLALQNESVAEARRILEEYHRANPVAPDDID